jgi:uncharacterized protein DUF642
MGSCALLLLCLASVNGCGSSSLAGDAGSGSSSGGSSGSSSGGSSSSSSGGGGSSSGASGGSSGSSSGASDGSAADAYTESGAPDAASGVDGSPDASAVGAGCLDAGSSLVKNGSFESPVVAVGGYQLFTNGADLAGWTVVGATGNVAPLSTTFSQNGFSFPAEDCAQSLDLTGTSNTATGVTQSVPTSAGTTYQLSFWVGNVVDPGGIFGTTSTVNVLVNGTQAMAAVNSGGAGTKTLSWEQFTVPFTATSSSTTIAFMNGDPPTDNSNMLDSVAIQ